MLDKNLISNLKKLFDIQFIKESFYSFLPTEIPYSDLLVVNNNNEFFTFSNSNVFVILLLQTDKKVIENVKEKLSLIYNREKYIVSFVKTEFEKVIYIDIDDLIEHSVKIGACENNLFNFKLKEIFGEKIYV